RERAKTLAILDLEIEVLLHGRRTGIAEDRARAERTRTELHASLEPADRELVGKRLRRGLDHVGFVEHSEMRARCGQPPLDVGLRELWPEISTRHAVAVANCPRLALELMIGGECRTHRAAGVACGGLDPDGIELAVAQHLAIRHAIERDAAGKTQIARAGLAR